MDCDREKTHSSLAVMTRWDKSPGVSALFRERSPGFFYLLKQNNEKECFRDEKENAGCTYACDWRFFLRACG
ncbi:hypothetical protein D9C14_06960 [Bacillus subtilis subsp. subtilis]|nr:hypothetical protein D9C14_06960 [Bacillus subtilis subsp. subtilis]QBJ84328.1 hypothetical protein DL538_20740 [Bacillus subtilis subsp. subtilis]